jgi:hypothetical protein
MKNTNGWSSFFVKAAFFILLTLSTVAFVQAQTVTFAQVLQRNGTNDFLFTNLGTSASFQTIQNGTPVIFLYQNVAGLPAQLQGPQNARLYLTATTTTPAVQAAGDPPRDIQPFSGTFTVQIIRDTPCNCGTGTQRNLLTAIVSPDGTTRSSLAGDDLSDAVAYTASDARQTVVYTSDFIGFLPTSVDNFGLSFSSVNPLLSIGPGGFLNSFSAAGTGTFASNVAPVFNPPTAAGVSIEGRVFNAYGTAASRALVTLTDESGSSTTVTTNGLGYFRFADIPAGQTVIVSVTSKGGTYEPRVISLNDNIDELNFHPVQ